MNKKIAITTDSSSGILPNECTGKNVFLLPMPFLINGECYFENVNLTQDVFYEKLAAGADVSTSQPSVGELTEFWTDVLKSYDELVHIPLSSGLSQSCASATALAKDFNGKVHVVNNRRVSVTLKQSVFDAKKLANQGKSALEINGFSKSAEPPPESKNKTVVAHGANSINGSGKLIGMVCVIVVNIRTVEFTLVFHSAACAMERVQTS